ncbi:hypothetical protein MHBO_001364 [Bonamia ostreae]|uniref:Uncharacterized protein n=1 Tax=Bonamia ostreae TaxID=126728 RepID=A0ABV2AJ88_9EUKA
MSSGDYDNLLSENSETEELGKAIRKGLEKNKKDFFESVSENAGTAEQIETLREKLIATKIAISVSSICHKTSFIKLEQNSEQKKDFYENRNSKNEDKSLLSNSKFSNFALAQTLILILHNLAVPQLSRGALAQQGGVSALLSLWRNCKNEKLSRLSANGISKLICSTNPNLLKFKQSFECARAIISTLENAEHELEQFEALRALTNIASVGEEERSRLIENGVWERAKEGLFCENFRVQRSAIELMANLLLCEKGLQKMADSPAELKIFELFCKSDDFKSQSAAVRVLAFVGYQKPLLIKNGGLDKSVFERMAESEDGSVRGFAKEVAELI